MSLLLGMPRNEYKEVTTELQARSSHDYQAAILVRKVLTDGTYKVWHGQNEYKKQDMR
jgi:hypothetical protein